MTSSQDCLSSRAEDLLRTGTVYLRAWSRYRLRVKFPNSVFLDHLRLLRRTSFESRSLAPDVVNHCTIASRRGLWRRRGDRLLFRGCDEWDIANSGKLCGLHKLAVPHSDRLILQNRYTRYSTKTSEEFNTASRSVKPGLIASGIVSAWTWAATLLQASTVAYEYGVAGPFWVDQSLCPIPS